MAIGPKIQKKDPFNQTLRGTFGRFKTTGSRQVYYLLCSLPIDEIDDLQTASDLFETDAVKFEELIQRDIDKARVIRMATDYLEAGSDKVVFFPPLLACIVLFDADGNMLHQYAEADEDIDGEGDQRVLRATWDEDGFELSLALGDKKTADRRLVAKGNEEWFHDAGQLRLNQKRAKLVVLDGQHRLEAMKLVRKGPSKETLAGVEIPICLVFTPSAVVGSQEDVVENFRELFVRVNEEAKRVSGHFIILLQDDSYSAMTMRALAESWRTKKVDGLTYLHLLEWNQRVEENTRRRSRQFSLTTIGILNDILRDYLFQEGIAARVLMLGQVEGEFAAVDPAFHYQSLGDQAHVPGIDKIVLSRIQAHLVPALDILLLTPAPYQRFILVVKQAFAKLKTQADAHNDACGALLEYFSKYKYTDEEIAEPVVRAALKEFNQWAQIQDSDGIYFLSAFQHGLIRAWIRFSTILAVHDLDPQVAARATVAGLEELALKPDKAYLASSRKYTRRVLWRNEKVNFSGTLWTRDVWPDILCASFLRPNVAGAALTSIGHQSAEQGKSVASQFRMEARNSARRYLLRLEAEILRDTKANIAELVPAGKLLELETLQSGDETARKQYDAEIRDLAEVRYNEARDEFANILGLKSSTFTDAE
jgi:hypothetical protein